MLTARATLALLIAAGTLAPDLGLTLTSEDPDPLPELYQALQNAQLRSAGALRNSSFEVDRIRFHFGEGELYLLDPAAGVVTGAVVLGKGTIRVRPPSAVERQQLDKHLDEEELDEEFNGLVMRFTDDSAERLRALTTAARKPDVGKAQKLYRDRIKKALENRLTDLDARVLHDLVSVARGQVASSSLNEVGRRQGYFAAEVDAKGWFTVDVDPLNREEIRIFQARDLRRTWDHWTHFHVASDYPAGGDEPEGGSPAAPQATLEGWTPAIRQLEVAVDLLLDNGEEVEGNAELLLEATRPLDALRLQISPILDVSQIRFAVPPVDRGGSGSPAPSTQPTIPRSDSTLDSPPGELPDIEGDPLEFVQAHVGRGLNEDRWDPRVTVVLPRTMAAGERFLLRFRYSGDLLARLRAGDFVVRDTETWYPRDPEAGRAKYDMTFRMPDRYRVASGGTLVDEQLLDGKRVARWVVDEPVAAMSFHYGRLDVDEYTPEGIPPISIYTSPNTLGFAPGAREKTLEDISGALGLYTHYFGPPPFNKLVLTETASSSGQSFPGFVRISFATSGGMHTGEAELFRTHELAHQWWGNAIGWDTYRDQWMSEGFAQYAAALYVLEGLGEEDKFLEMMSAWSKDVRGQMDVAQAIGVRHYGFSPGAMRVSDGNKTGALWVGYRLNSDDTPIDYRVQIYEKGAYVLHMLRMMLVDWEGPSGSSESAEDGGLERNSERSESPSIGDDTRFRRMMREFSVANVGKDPSTEDFLAAVSRAFDQPMDWFFDQWVYGTEVPVYRADLEAERDPDGTWHLRGRVRQEDVADDFRMPVPIRVSYENQEPIVHTIWVDRPEVEVDLPLPDRDKPDDIEFNVMFAVLAQVK